MRAKIKIPPYLEIDVEGESWKAVIVALSAVIASLILVMHALQKTLHKTISHFIP